jgi:mediator of RNA polymerase II transcription subunit 12
MRNFHRPRSSKADIAASYQTPRQKLISLLDNQTPHVDVRALSVLTRDLVHDFNVLVSTLIEWSATLHRVGLSRIYIALRLLRHWKSEGIDLHPSIFSVMSDIRRLTILHPSNMYKLFGELVRSGLVSVGRYLQWLLARGRGGYSNESDAVCPLSHFTLL